MAPVLPDLVDELKTLRKGRGLFVSRIDDGIHHIAQLAAAQAGGGPPTSSPWRTTELRVALALDRRYPEVLQYRRIVAERDGLIELDLALAVAAPVDGSLSRDLGVALFHGGTLVARGPAAGDRLRFGLVLPRPLARGEAHEFAVQLRLPADRPPRPRLVCAVPHPCALLDLRVRFDRADPPAAVWSVRETPGSTLDDPAAPGEPALVDHAGETHLVVRDLTPGTAYGLRWDRPHRRSGPRGRAVSR